VPAFNPPVTVDEINAAFPGRYASLEVLKSGGQGAVFKAVVAVGPAEPLGTPVAFKLYNADQLEERTQREVEALRAIQVDSLVRFVDNGHADIRGVPCVWLETAFVDGECLANVLQRGPMAVRSVATIVCDIASAIEQLWIRRIVHRDVKPDNIMLRPNGHGVLIDLGVARHIEMPSLTTHGKTWGTEGYLSPEQSRAIRTLTCKSDIFALGLVAQEALLGRHPTGRRQQLLAGGGPPTASLQHGLPPVFCTLLDRMVHRDPVRRISPAEVVTGMRIFTQPQPE
jgi:serine/threonine-protein kinase